MKGIFTMSKILPIVVGLFLLSLSAGCISQSANQSFLRQDVDFGFIKTIGVLPFENNTADQYVAERLRDMTMTDILSAI